MVTRQSSRSPTPPSTHPADETAPPPKLIALGRRRIVTKRSGGVQFWASGCFWAASPPQIRHAVVRLDPARDFAPRDDDRPRRGDGHVPCVGSNDGQAGVRPKMSSADLRLSGWAPSLALPQKVAFIVASAPNRLIADATALVSRRSPPEPCETSYPTTASSHE